MGRMSETIQAGPAVGDLAGCRNLAQEVVEQALQAGASSAEVAIGSGVGLSVDVRSGEVETIEHNRGHALAVTVYDGVRKGSATSNDFSPTALRECVEAALTIARHGGEDAYAGLADPSHLATSIPDLDLDHPQDYPAETAIDIARACEAAALGFDARISNSEGASCSRDRSTSAYANSNGFCAGWTGTRYSVGASVITGAGDTMQRAHWYGSGRVFEELDSPEAIGRRAGERAIARIGSRKIPSTSAPVLFEAPAAASLVNHFISAISGSALYRRASFLLDAAGEQIFPPGMQIAEHPHLMRGPGSAPFDSDGVATRERDLVSAGTLMSYALSVYSARRLGLDPTGNAGGVRNVSVHLGDRDAPDFRGLLREMDTGLVVTGLMGFGVNNVTGDYSRGAVGFWVEGGEIAFPVEEITVAGNLRDMFMHIAAIGSDVDRRGNIHTGSILVDGMSIAGD